MVILSRTYLSVKNLAKAVVVFTVCVAFLAAYFYHFKGLPGLGKKSTENHRLPTMASLARECFMITPKVQATATVIFLHGLGDQGAGWAEAFKEIKKDHIRYIFPNAPSIPVTLNGGMVMPAWFDLKGLSPQTMTDEEGIKAAAKKVDAMIRKETTDHGIPSTRIVIGGFSMGGALALFSALKHPDKLGGVIALSSWLPMHDSFTQNKEGFSLSQQRCDIFQGHGTDDPMVKVTFGQVTNTLLKSQRDASVTTEFKTYDQMGHSSCPKEMEDVKERLDKWLPVQF